MYTVTSRQSLRSAGLGVISASAACTCAACGCFSCHEEDTTVGHLVHGVRVLDVCGWEISVFSLQIGRGGGGGGGEGEEEEQVPTVCMTLCMNP